MGGRERRDDPWRLHPESDAIVLGTVDMLLSRALNRGYAASRFSWPIDFGLFNNGVAWVLDEVQLLGPALPTTRQLQAFRQRLGTALPTSSTWMSATVDPAAMATVDNPELASGDHRPTRWAGRQRQRGLQQPRAGGGVHRAVDATATAQICVRSGHDGLDVLTGDVTPHHGDLHARTLPDSARHRAFVHRLRRALMVTRRLPSTNPPAPPTTTRGRQGRTTTRSQTAPDPGT